MARLAIADFEKIQSRIEGAALRRFTRSGYNGVTMREVAEDARVPLGSLYNYFQDKEALFKHLIDSQSKEFLDPSGPLALYLLNSKFPSDLEQMAEAIAASVAQSASYFKLMYVDVVELEGRHIRNVFSNLEEKFQGAMKDRFREVGLLGPDHSIEPSFAFVTVYLTFYQYFILTGLFGAKEIYNRDSHKKTVKDLIHLFRCGIQRGPP